MRTEPIRAADLTRGMRLVLINGERVKITAAFRMRVGPLIWLELSNGVMGAVEPDEVFNRVR